MGGSMIGGMKKTQEMLDFDEKLFFWKPSCLFSCDF